MTKRVIIPKEEYKYAWELTEQEWCASTREQLSKAYCHIEEAKFKIIKTTAPLKKTK